jgi:hypothetical protein
MIADRKRTRSASELNSSLRITPLVITRTLGVTRPPRWVYGPSVGTKACRLGADKVIEFKGENSSRYLEVQWQPGRMLAPGMIAAGAKLLIKCKIVSNTPPRLGPAL